MDALTRGLEAVPGGVIVSVPLQRLLGQHVQNVMTDFAAGVTTRLQELRVDVDGALQRDDFMSDFMKASTIAVTDASAEKRRRLRNAVVHCITSPPDQARRQIYFSLIDRLSDLHVVLVDLFNTGGPGASETFIKWSAANAGKTIATGSSAAKVAETLLGYPIELIRHCWAEAIAAGLVERQIDNGMEGDPLKIERTTEFGRAFLKFIRD